MNENTQGIIPILMKILRIERVQNYVIWLAVYFACMVPIGLLILFWIKVRPSFDIMILFSVLYIMITLPMLYSVAYSAGREAE